MDRERPLAGVRVLDLTRFVAGPYCTSLLVGQGAQVVKVEPPEGEQNRVLGPMVSGSPDGPEVSTYFLRFAEGKLSVAIDLKDPRGAVVMKDLVRQADVLVENFRPGVLDRLGLGWDRLQQLNAGLIYCSITGFGSEDSPMRDQGAFTPVVEALSGAMVYRSADEAPTIAGYPVGDIFPAALSAAAIAMALYRRTRDGHGARIDMSMFDAMLSMNERAVALSTIIGRDILPGISADLGSAPSGAFAAKDGYVSISVVGELVWQRFCKAIDRPEWATDPALSSGPLRADKMNTTIGPVILQWLADKTRAEAVAHLVAYDVPATPVHRPTELKEVEQVKARGMLGAYEQYDGVTPWVVADPIRFAGEQRRVMTSAARVGEHTSQVLSEWCGYSASVIDELAGSGVVVSTSSAADSSDDKVV